AGLREYHRSRRLGREAPVAERIAGRWGIPAMKMVVFGLTVSSSWGNGHATLWRGLCASLTRLGWHVVFFEQNVPYYAHTRDLHALPGGTLVLYETWDEVAAQAARHVGEADVAMVTSYGP